MNLGVQKSGLVTEAGITCLHCAGEGEHREFCRAGLAENVFGILQGKE